MTITAEVPTRSLTSMLRAAAIGCTMLAGGCANGDFGEVKPSLVRDGIHDWVGNIGGPRSAFELTDDERQLRDLAFPLMQPPYDRQQWYSVAQEYGAMGRTDSGLSAYAWHLQGARFRSPSARYAQLIDDVRNDIVRAPAFFENAARVIDTDRKRDKSLAFVSGLSAQDRDNAYRRMHENASIARMVHGSVMQRAASYHFALERLVVATPSAQAIEAERAINELRQILTRYRFGAPPGRRGAGNLASAR